MAQATKESPAERLARIQNGYSSNDDNVIAEFEKRGIPTEEIQPRQNVLTYKAWRAKGRQVCKGAKGFKIPVWIEGQKTDKTNGKVETFKACRTIALFHISQTKPAETKKSDQSAPKAGAKPAEIITNAPF